MNTFAGYPLCDVRGPLADRSRFRRGAIEYLQRANSLYCPSGRWPSRGWVLLPRSEYDSIDKYSMTLEMEIGSTVSLRNLVIVQAQCVTRGLESDLNALYLIEITDRRGILYNEWFKFPLTAMYNVRAPAYPQTFYTASLNSGSPWTWSTMVQDIWQKMQSILGAWPGLPTTPTGTPEGFWFTGVPAWTALCDVLKHIGMTIACDLQNSNSFTIVEQGAADASFAALTTTYAPNLEDDLEWIDIGAGRIPANVKVLFRRRNSIYGSEETVTYRNDEMAKQWVTDSYYSVTIDAPDDFSSAVGTHYIWSDFTVRYDDSGNPLDADITTARAIARERVSQYFDAIAPAAYMSRTYAGAIPFATGSLVDGVHWKQDYSWRGWTTEVVYGPDPPWRGLWVDN